jgi:hypothetical protein
MAINELIVCSCRRERERERERIELQQNKDLNYRGFVWVQDRIQLCVLSLKGMIALCSHSHSHRIRF